MPTNKLVSIHATSLNERIDAASEAIAEMAGLEELPQDRWENVDGAVPVKGMQALESTQRLAIAVEAALTNFDERITKLEAASGKKK